MADISKLVVSENIKNGTLLVTVYPTGPTDSNKNNDYVYNKPVLSEIEDKYLDKFDDTTYYTA